MIVGLPLSKNIERGSNWLRSSHDKLYRRFLVVWTWPKYVNRNWLQKLYAYPGLVDVSVWFEPVKASDVIKKLTKQPDKLEEMADQIEKNPLADKREKFKLRRAAQDAERIADALSNEEHNLFRVGLYIQLRSDTIEGLDDLTNKILGLCHAKRLSPLVESADPLGAYFSCLPIGADFLNVRRAFDGPSAAAMMPFATGELPSHKTGIVYGRTLSTEGGKNVGGPVQLDRFEHDNYNSVIVGRSGAGKSMVAKLEVIRYLLRGVDIQIVDPKEEYVRFVKALGGYICYDPADAPPIGTEPRLICYPIPLSLLHKEREAIMAKALDTAWKRAQEPPLRKQIVLVDEAWDILKDSRAGESLFRLAKMARSLWCGVTTVTQNLFQDILESPLGESTITEATMKIILPQDNKSIKGVVDTFDLSPGEAQFVKRADQGTGLVIAGQNRGGMKFEIPDFMYRISTTNPVDLRRYAEEEMNQSA